MGSLPPFCFFFALTHTTLFHLTNFLTKIIHFVVVLYKNVVYTGYNLLTLNSDDYMSEEAVKTELTDEELAARKADSWTADKIPASYNDLQTLLDELARWYVLTHPDFVKTAKEKDPAIKEKSDKEAGEELQSYPFVAAIAAHEIAHHLYKEGKKNNTRSEEIVARRLAEAAHSRSGIDIHPGTTIGENCFIDHGTGDVIGETATIGKETMIYHRVTLGAIGKTDTNHRHPEIGEQCFISNGVEILGHVIVGNKVTICPDAHIYGNSITIGNGATIGIGAKIMSKNRIADDVKIGSGVTIAYHTGDINKNIPADSYVSKGEDGELKIISTKENDSILHKFVKLVMEAVPNLSSPYPAPART